MYSKGQNIRTVKHPILQNGFKVILKVTQRRWKCTNKECFYTINDQFSFLSKNAQTTNFIPYHIIFDLKDINLTVTQVDNRYNLSDNTVSNYLLRYVEMPRKLLSEYLSVDEVFLDIDDNHKYALVLMDFMTKKIIDIYLVDAILNQPHTF